MPPDFVFDPLHVAAAESLDFAAQLEVAADLIVIQDTEAIDDGRRPSDHGYQCIGIERQKLLVAC